MTVGKEATSLVVPGGDDAGPLELSLLIARGHASGAHVVVLGGVHGDEYEGVAAAAAFGAPVYWGHPDVSPGRSLSVALAAGVVCIYAECGGGGRVRPADLRAYRQGVRRVLAHIGALAPMAPAPVPDLRLRSTGD